MTLFRLHGLVNDMEPRIKEHDHYNWRSQYTNFLLPV